MWPNSCLISAEWAIMATDHDINKPHSADNLFQAMAGRFGHMVREYKYQRVRAWSSYNSTQLQDSTRLDDNPL